ncbi:MAG TPA: cob(I)yrinic acid a,c-diamide adenosyltransferase [Thermoanaerobaculia bacterium]|jgi:cob(I)alamin adenosyltransferase|nr:cob(I)yrinic acid a,c-diamide adenosyltransferase [Thermoanaerobaculia bacterium]
MKIYTRTGDKGETSLFGGARVPKNDPRIEAYGTIDELSSHLGVARAAWPASPIDPQLHQAQLDLFEIGAHLASPGTSRFPGVEPARIGELESGIDEMERELPPLTTFILPGGTLAAAQLHVARTVCRRAERLVVALGSDEAGVVIYLNRLSDYLFVAARFANKRQGVDDVPWKR